MSNDTNAGSGKSAVGDSTTESSIIKPAQLANAAPPRAGAESANGAEAPGPAKS